MSYKDPIILLGSQRSGTTALSFILNEVYSENNGFFSINGKLLYYLNRWLTTSDLVHRHFRVDEILYSLKRKVPFGKEKEVDKWLKNVEVILREVALEVANGKHYDPILLSRAIINRSYSIFDLWGEKYNEYLYN